jgi:hypothetical protein
MDTQFRDIQDTSAVLWLALRAAGYSPVVGMEQTTHEPTGDIYANQFQNEAGTIVTISISTV